MTSVQETPLFNVRWNQITWYSRFGAVILFLGVIPALSFYIGTQYQAVRDMQHATNADKATQDSGEQTQKQTKMEIDAHYASQDISLPAGTMFQSVSTSNGYSFEWPVGWKIVKQSSDIINLYDRTGTSIATIHCPVARTEGPYGVYTLKTMQRVFNANGTNMTVRYSENEDEDRVPQGIGVWSTEMIVFSDKDAYDVYQAADTCEIDGNLNPINRIGTEKLAALRHIYESWK